jgi:hypothetical protein
MAVRYRPFFRGRAHRLIGETAPLRAERCELEQRPIPSQSMRSLESAPPPPAYWSVAPFRTLKIRVSSFASTGFTRCTSKPASFALCLSGS